MLNGNFKIALKNGLYQEESVDCIVSYLIRTTSKNIEIFPGKFVLK